MVAMTTKTLALMLLSGRRLFKRKNIGHTLLLLQSFTNGVAILRE
jgi:hypothetical protein